MSIHSSFYHIAAVYWLVYLFCLPLCLIPESGHTQDALKLPVVQIQSELDNIEESGSGIMVGRVGKDLYILTAAHVIANPKDLRIQFFQGSPVRAQVLQTNSALDIAALKCTVPMDFGSPSSFALAKESEKALQSVIVIGHPLGNYWDINYNSNVKSTEHELDERLFTLAPIGIAPGNSGGPVLNLRYELLGLVREVDPVKAVCVDVGTLLKACQAWEVPTNLLTGITVENTPSAAGDQDFRYQVFVQEANTAFAAGKWAQAKRAFEQANELARSQVHQSKILQCEEEMAKDALYQQFMTSAEKAPRLEEALAFYKQAQEQHNSEEVRLKISLMEQKLAKLEVPDTKSKTSSDLPKNYQHPLAGSMALVQGGTFMMGEKEAVNDDEYPPHRVYLADYYIGANEITNEQYCRFLNEFAEAFPDVLDKKKTFISGFSDISRKREARKTIFYPKEGYENLPVETNWYSADAFCQWLSEKTRQVYRLPTEAEWEYAAKGGRQSKGTKYAGSNDPEKVAWFYNNTMSYSGAHIYSERRPVMSKAPNELGLYDMNGNVWEWCADWYSEDYYKTCNEEGTVTDPVGAPTGNEKVSRGGSASSKIEKEHASYELSMSCRRPIGRTGEAGFRIVRATYAVNVFRDPFEAQMRLIKGGTFFLNKSSGNQTSYASVSVKDFYFCDQSITLDAWKTVMGMGQLPSTFTYWLDNCDDCVIKELPDEEIREFLDKLNQKTGKHYRLATQVELEYRKHTIGLYSTSGFHLTRDGDMPSEAPPFQDPFEKKMVWAEGGTFQMGSEIEKPLHEVTVDGFYISPTEITWKTWLEVMGESKSVTTYCPECPVGGVSWNEAQQFIERLNTLSQKTYRLPTEAEWEFAARGGNKGKDHNFLYSGSNQRETVAWQDNSQTGNPQPVGQKDPNELGLFDMSGNVSEWCLDWYHPGFYAKSIAKNPAGYNFGGFKILRGGGLRDFIFGDDNPLAVSYRTAKAIDEDDPMAGFRIVLSNGPIPIPQSFEDPFSSDMVLISGGTFNMGQVNTNLGGPGASLNESPVHSVTVPGFYLDKYEVTRKQWFLVTGYYPEYQENCESCPVSNISSDEIEYFFKILSIATGKKYRLATEAEWEYAAGGGQRKKRSVFAGTDQESNLYKFGNYCGKGCKDPFPYHSRDKREPDGFPEIVAPVGTFSPNQIGLYDMSGNVSEVCLDQYHANYLEAPTNGTAWLKSAADAKNVQVIRGGDYMSTATQTRISTRSPMTDKSEQIGFRLAISQ